MSSSQMMSACSINPFARTVARPPLSSATSPGSPRPGPPAIPPQPFASSSRSHSVPPLDTSVSRSSWSVVDASGRPHFNPWSSRADAVAKSDLDSESKTELSKPIADLSSDLKDATNDALDPAESELNATLRARAGQPIANRKGETKKEEGQLDTGPSSFVSKVPLVDIDDSGEEEMQHLSEEDRDTVPGDDRVNAWGRRASDYVSGKLGFFNGKGEPWLIAEEEDMARFLASDPENQRGGGGSIWAQYEIMRPRRNAASYKKHYSDRTAAIDRRVRSIKRDANGQPVAYDPSQSPDLGPIIPPSHRRQSPQPNRASRVVDDADDNAVGMWGRRPSEYANGICSATGWLVAEEEDLALFLASEPADKDAQEGGTIWEQYARSHPKRHHVGYHEHYKKSRAGIDAMVDSIKAAADGHPVEYRHPDVSRRPSSNPALSDAERRLAVPRQTYVSGSSMFAAPAPEKKRPVKCYNCGATDSGSWHKMKGGNACGSCRSAHYKAEKRQPGSGHHILGQRRQRALAGGDMRRKFDPVPDNALVFDSDADEASDSESEALTSDEDEPIPAPSRVLPQPARSHRDYLEQGEDLPAPLKRPRLGADQSAIAPYRSQPVASGSGVSHHHHRQAPPPAAYQHRPPAPPAPAPRPAAAGAGLARLEPEAFLDVDVPPAHHPHNLPFCFFCGEGSPASAPYAQLVLATENSKGAVDRVAGQMACTECRGWFRTELGLARLADGGEADEMERMGAVTRRLVARGVGIRSAKVEV